MEVERVQSPVITSVNVNTSQNATLLETSAPVSQYAGQPVMSGFILASNSSNTPTHVSLHQYRENTHAFLYTDGLNNERPIWWLPGEQATIYLGTDQSHALWSGTLTSWQFTLTIASDGIVSIAQN